jgi:hypothetical protein
MIFTTRNKAGRLSHHLHDGHGHAVCGCADDDGGDNFEVIDYDADKITCKDCLVVIRGILASAKKYNVK